MGALTDLKKYPSVKNVASETEAPLQSICSLRLISVTGVLFA